MTITQNDLEALKGYDITRAYCEAALGQPVRRGRVLVFPCPFGTHTRPHLELADLGGVGITLCRSCNIGGTVLDVAAAVLGMDAHRNFAACVREVAERVGYTLHDEPADRGVRRGRPRAALRPMRPALMPDEPQDLPPPEQEKALRAVERARRNPQMMQAHAEALGLPLADLLAHTDPNDAAAGLLGLDESDHLLYVYTHRGSDGLHVLMVKTRSHPAEVARGVPRFLCRGRKCALFGADLARRGGGKDVYITEGESDALAVRAAFRQLLDYLSHNAPENYPGTGWMPAVLAKPDAGTFRADWATPFADTNVTLIADSDEAGLNGARKTAHVLYTAGADRVLLWTPSEGMKDARAALRLEYPMALAEDIFHNRKMIE
ncbi:MAG: toprim domain-containing protein [Akkermansia sp.]